MPPFSFKRVVGGGSHGALNRFKKTVFLRRLFAKLKATVLSQNGHV